MEDIISRVNAILGLILTIGMIALGAATFDTTKSYTLAAQSTNVDTAN